MAKVGKVGSSSGIVIPAKVLRLLGLKRQDLVQVAVTVTGVSEPVSGNRGAHLKGKKFDLVEKEEKQDGTK